MSLRTGVGVASVSRHTNGARCSLLALPGCVRMSLADVVWCRATLVSMAKTTA